MRDTISTVSIILVSVFSVLFTTPIQSQDRTRVRDMGIEIGVMDTGSLNAITDVPGVQVGHQTLIKGDSVRTGVTAILPHSGNLFQQKVPAAVYMGNGFGKLVGSTQIEELGNLETPILLTNTLSVSDVMSALVDYSLQQPGNEQVRSVNAVVGETNDGYLNEIRGRHVTEEDAWAAIEAAQSGPVAEGNVGAGTGTIAFGWKGGIGTSSRMLPESLGGYTVGVLVQSNFGGVLQINGVPVGKKLGQYYLRDDLLEQADGSCMMVVLTDAPVGSRNLKRMARRAIMGLARTGGIASNGSGDYVIAASTAEEVRIPYRPVEPIRTVPELYNGQMSPLFMATIESTEEAILNSLFMAETMSGYKGRTIEALPLDAIEDLFKD
ncbi:MAG: P1 family peptidase [Bacteroidota bacterium]